MRFARILALGATVLVAAGWQDTSPALWLDANGQPNQRAQEALVVIAEAGSHGLDPAFYRPAPEAMTGGVRFESEMTRGLTRYVSDLHRGRVDPQALGLLIDKRNDSLDVTEAVRLAATARRLRELARDFAPQTNQYRSLQVALAKYRALAADTSLLPLPLGNTVIHAGESFLGATALHARLVRFGDLAPETPVPQDGLLSPDLVEGVKAFQRRHGLTDDGVIGTRTLAALQVPLTTRVRQVELALERLRWLPRDVHDRVIIVNIPMFRLWAIEANSPPDVAPLTMRVIVGWAKRTRTPVFTADLRAVVFRPYWNVPLSIARNEIVPKVRRDPDYMVRNHFQIVSGESNEAAAVPPTPDALEQVAGGRLRIRQRPGPDNSLGLIKFDFPNRFSVYMHGTPALQLFKQDQRDFSHGCIRVEDTVTLAQWVLDDAAWSREAITEAMNGDDARPVSVTRPTRVWVFYTTAVALPGGSTHFAADLYGHDGRLDRALRGR